MTKPLTVYKASAGSGKTFTLAVEYIKLLVENPQQYRNILAVTFTNKATEEMKMRILSQLYGIWNQYPDSDQYTKKICAELNCSVEFLRGRVNTALKLLIHNYSFFRIETIDSFFQSVLRNLAHELDLTPNLRIELNDDEVEERAVDKMIEELTPNKDIMDWIMAYIRDAMQDDKSWNVIGQIKKFGLTIFKDFYKDNHKELSDAIGDIDAYKAYIRHLKKERDEAVNRVKKISASFYKTIGDANLTVDDFLYKKSGVVGLFEKIKNGPIPPSEIKGRQISAVGNPDNWVTNKHKRADEIKALVSSDLNPLLEQVVNNMANEWKTYQTAQLTLRHLYQLRLLDAIEKTVRTMNEEAGQFLLSDTQHLLRSLIDNSDSPFIFEKIGSRLEHIMIDEFQDTSVVQWNNFKVLLEECMSHKGSHNLIVGDVKQSIYRWRSGDWRLLNDIEGNFRNASKMVEVMPLKTNYRSQAVIINFNNVFFKEAKTIEYDNHKLILPDDADQLRRGYSDVVQRRRRGIGKKGLVEITLLPKEDSQQETLKMVSDTLKTLIEAGAKQSDIAILVRTNASIPLIADYLAQECPDIQVVSDEAFRLQSSTAVCIIVDALHLLTHPDDILTRYSLVMMYQTMVMKKDADMNDIFLNTAEEDWLPSEFTEHRQDLLLMPLFDLAQRLCNIFKVNDIEGQTAYICAFFDQLTKFSTDTTSDIDAFVNHWYESVAKKNIRSDEANGVRILSIHKSKGLEYEHVIIPFCDWDLEPKAGSMIWCKPEPIQDYSLPIVPIDYSSKALGGTRYETDYHKENFQNTVDNLNLLYVAFTRAGRSLFVIGTRASKSRRSYLLEECLPIVLQKLSGSIIEGVDDKEAKLIFKYGQLDICNKEKAESKNVMLAKSSPVRVTFDCHDSNVVFKQSNKSREFIEGESEQAGYIKSGNVLHYVFSKIKTKDDIDHVLNTLDNEGIFDNVTMTKKSVRNMLHKRLNHPVVSQWFAPGLTLYNECTILQYDKDEKKVVECRPDRVVNDGKTMTVIDFKFGNPHDEHVNQVQGYMKTMKEMGHYDVKGYVWYVFMNNIVEVKA